MRAGPEYGTESSGSCTGLPLLEHSAAAERGGGGNAGGRRGLFGACAGAFGAGGGDLDPGICPDPSPFQSSDAAETAYEGLLGSCARPSGGAGEGFSGGRFDAGLLRDPPTVHPAGSNWEGGLLGSCRSPCPVRGEDPDGGFRPGPTPVENAAAVQAGGGNAGRQTGLYGRCAGPFKAEGEGPDPSFRPDPPPIQSAATVEAWEEGLHVEPQGLLGSSFEGSAAVQGGGYSFDQGGAVWKLCWASILILIRIYSSQIMQTAGLGSVLWDAGSDLQLLSFLMAGSMF